MTVVIFHNTEVFRVYSISSSFLNIYKMSLNELLLIIHVQLLFWGPYIPHILNFLMANTPLTQWNCFDLSVSPETAVSFPSLHDSCMKQSVLSQYIDDAVYHNLIQESSIVDLAYILTISSPMPVPG